MKKCVLILVCALLVCLCSLALAQEVTLSLPGKNASVNAGMTYDVTISADAPVATATDFVLTCADIGFSAAGQIPAGEQETTVKVDIPANKGGGNRITFALEGQTAKHQVQVYSLPNVQFYIFGHEHKLMERDLFDTGLIYYGVSNIEKKQYYIFTIKDDGYEYEVVEF